MRCYFMRDGHISDVELLPGLDDEEAFAAAKKLYEDRKEKAHYDGFEVWDEARKIISIRGNLVEFEATKNRTPRTG